MNTSQSTKYIEVYDTTLRDGTQGQGISFSLIDKLKIASQLDQLGVDYIEGGYPLSNPKDATFFEQVRSLDLKHAEICAFGMTRRRDTKPENDAGMNALINAATPVITIVGKSWDLHVDEVLKVSRDENLDMIKQSVEYCANTPNPNGKTAQVFYDAEHFFDGYRANKDYALNTLRAALDGGAQRLILCDTNGGSLPQFIAQVVTQLRESLGQNVQFGIHPHNDSGLAVANALTAIDHGCTQVQGTINGFGERCGNVDLTTVVADMLLKTPYSCLDSEQSLAKLTETSRFVYELANMNLDKTQPFVGSAAFTHKGGMHVHAVNRISKSYEHINPQSVGNQRHFLVSELAGVSNITTLFGDKFNITNNKPVQQRLLQRIQQLENAGYQFETANASLELLLRSELEQRKKYWTLEYYRCVILKKNDNEPTTEAIVKVAVNSHAEHHVAEGDGPVNALDAALRKCLEPHYPQLADIHLRDFRVRVVNATAESAAKVRVVIDFAINNPDKAGQYISTIGVSENIVQASWQAIIDAFEYHLLEYDVKSLQ